MDPDEKNHNPFDIQETEEWDDDYPYNEDWDHLDYLKSDPEEYYFLRGSDD